MADEAIRIEPGVVSIDLELEVMRLRWNKKVRDLADETAEIARILLDAAAPVNDEEVTPSFYEPGNLKAAIFKTPLSRSLTASATGQLSLLETSEVDAYQSTVGVNLELAPYAEYVNSGTGLYGPYEDFVTPTHEPTMRYRAYGSNWSLGRTKGQRGQHYLEKAYAGAETFFDARFVELASTLPGFAV